MHLHNVGKRVYGYPVSREPPRLLVKIHLITEHYRAEGGVMIAERLHVIEIVPSRGKERRTSSTGLVS